MYLFGIPWNLKKKYLLRFYFDNLFYKTVNFVPLTSKISTYFKYLVRFQGNVFILIELLQICEIHSRSSKLRKELVFLFSY